jgi:hypothetical protein
MSSRRRILGRHAALGALSLTSVALACHDREDRIRQPRAEAGQGNVAPGPSGDEGNGDGSSQGGQPQGGGAPSLLAGTSAGEDAAAGAAGTTSEICDAACLESVTSQTSDFGMAWQSSWFLAGCPVSVGEVRRCIISVPCPNTDAKDFADQGLSTVETFPIGSVPGRRYKVTFTFNAVMSAKHYEGGTRDQGDQVAPNEHDAVHDSFYRDGAPIPPSIRCGSWRSSTSWVSPRVATT